MIKLELNETELQALVGLMNAGVQAMGLRAVKDAAVLINKIEAATAAKSNNVVTLDNDEAA